MPAIVPNLWFDGNAQDAVDFYLSVFPNSKIAATQCMYGQRRLDIAAIEAAAEAA